MQTYGIDLAASVFVLILACGVLLAEIKYGRERFKERRSERLILKDYEDLGE